MLFCRIMARDAVDSLDWLFLYNVALRIFCLLVKAETDRASQNDLSFPTVSTLPLEMGVETSWFAFALIMPSSGVVC